MIRRKCTHKCVCNNDKRAGNNINVYKFVRAKGVWENWDMVCVEDYPCDSKHEMHTRERYWMETLHATLNKCVPTRSKNEWRENNTEKLKEYAREYNEINSEKRNQLSRDYRKNNHERIKEESKIFYKKNAERLKEKQREYHKNNYENIKDSRNEKAREKISCPHCNKLLNRSGITRHIKTVHK